MKTTLYETFIHRFHFVRYQFMIESYFHFALWYATRTQKRKAYKVHASESYEKQ